MCAINPTYKKRFIIDVYTSAKRMTREEFEDLALSSLTCVELQLNSVWPHLRFHLKETTQEAD